MRSQQLVYLLVLTLCAASTEQGSFSTAYRSRQLQQDGYLGEDFGPALAAQVSGAPSPSSSPQSEAEALRIFQQGSRNFQSLQAAGLEGWADPTGISSDPCNGWTGITCDDSGHVTALTLTSWNLETRLPPELSLLTSLKILNLTGNNLSGGLPSNWGLSSIFPSLQILDLSQNPSLSGALPPNWGTQGAFPSLQVLSLSSTGISGQLPAAWGGQLSLPQLVQLDLSDNVLGGVLPDAWGTVGAFAKLEDLELSNNSFSGPLPGQWGSSSNGAVLPSLQRLDLSSNRLTGSLPSVWGTGFEELSELSLQDNALEGPLPSDWAGEGVFLNLTLLDIHDNSLSGSLPKSWNEWEILANLDLVLTPGNRLCGSPSPALLASLSSDNRTTLPPCSGNPSMAPVGMGPSLSPSPIDSPPLLPLVSRRPPPNKQLPPLRAPPSPQLDTPTPAPPFMPTQSPAAPLPLLPASPTYVNPRTPASPHTSSTPAPAPEPSPCKHCLVLGVPPWRAPVPAPHTNHLGPALAHLPLPSPPPTPLPSIAQDVPSLAPVGDSSPPVPAPTLLVSLPPAEQPSASLQMTTAPAPGPQVVLEEPGSPAPEPAAAPTPTPALLVLPPEEPMNSPEPAPAPEVVVLSPPEESPVPSPLASQAPAPGPDSPAQVSARYILNGPNLDQGNETIRGILVSAMNETLLLGRSVPISLQSFSSTSSRRMLLAGGNTAQAVFSFNTTDGAAPALVNMLNSSETTTRYVQQLGRQGLPNIEPTLNETSINSPLISAPFGPIPGPGGMSPAPSVVPISQGGSSISGGAIAGIIVGALGAVLLASALWYLCRRRSKSRQKSEEEGSEKRDPEDAGDSEAEAGSHPGFFGRLKRKRSTYAVKADATPGGQKQGQKGQQPVERAIQPSKSSRSKALVAGLLPQTWRSKPETPSDPSTPSGTPTSALSDSAAKAAHKYKFGTGESLGARFARSVPDNSWAGKRTLGDMDSFEELEGHQIQTIPEALLEEGSHEGLQSREPEVRTRFEIPSQASTPASWPVSEITELGSEDLLLPNYAQHRAERPRSHFLDPEYSFGSSIRKPNRTASTHSKQALDVPSGSAFRLRSGEQYPSSYSRRGLEDQSHQHKAQRLAASRSTKESFDGHEKISKGGFVKRAAQDDRPPPSSFSRRQVEDPRVPKPAEEGRRSAPASRQNSAALPRRASANLPSSLLRASSGDARSMSGDLKVAMKQSKGILRHSGDEAKPDSNLPRSSSGGHLPGSARSGLSRSGSLQRVVSFEDEKTLRDDPPSRAGSLRSGSSGEGRLLNPRNDLATVREVPSSSSRRYLEDIGREPKPGPSQHRQQASSGRTPPSRVFSRQPSQEPRFKPHMEPAASTAEERTNAAHELDGASQPPSAGRTRSGRLDSRRGAVPSPRGPLDEREDKWEREAARLKLLEQHMRHAITPRSREKADLGSRKPAEPPRQAHGRSGSKPSLEEMLVLIDDARKLYSPGSETRQKLDLKAQEFSARLELERQRQRAARRTEADL